MDNLIVNSVKKLLEVNKLNSEIYQYLSFYDELRELKEVEKIYEALQKWLEKSFQIKPLKVIIYSKRENKNQIPFQNFENEAYLDKKLCKYYKIDINSDLLIIFCLVCNDDKHFKNISLKDTHLNTLFYMIAPFIATVSYQELVKELTFKDTLTNAYNRKFLVEHLNKTLPLARRENKNISFLMVGIDHFKAVIDEFDYDIGDKLLINLSNVLKNNIRESDLLVRLDADEFLITLVGTTNKEDAILVAQKLIDSFSSSSIVVNDNNDILKKSICIGISYYDNQMSIDEILRTADISLYEAKNLGRGKIKEYLPSSVDCVDLF